MDAPPVEYAKTEDGYSIAYGVSGVGVPYVFVAFSLPHVQLSWQNPVLRPWLEGLAARFQLIQYDPRGCGLSSRGLRPDHAQEDLLLDLEAVIAKLGVGRFILHGVGLNAQVFLRYALKHPERVAGLIYSGLGSSLATLRAPAMFETLPGQDWETFLYSTTQRDWQPDMRRDIVELFKQTFSPQDFVKLMNAHLRAGGREADLGRLATPTLVLHPRDYFIVPVEEAMKVAQMAGARFELIDGSASYGDAVSGLRAVERFVESLPPPVGGEPNRIETGLSAREVEVLRLLAAGRSNQQVADDLVISLNTVRRHVSNIFAKTGAANRADAVSYAHRQGLIANT